MSPTRTYSPDTRNERPAARFRAATACRTSSDGVAVAHPAKLVTLEDIAVARRQHRADLEAVIVPVTEHLASGPEREIAGLEDAHSGRAVAPISKVPHASPVPPTVPEQPVRHCGSGRLRAPERQFTQPCFR